MEYQDVFPYIILKYELWKILWSTFKFENLIPFYYFQDQCFLNLINILSYLPINNSKNKFIFCKFGQNKIKVKSNLRHHKEIGKYLKSIIHNFILECKRIL